MKSKLDKLEKIRGFAALYVFAGHLVLERLQITSKIGVVFRFGQEAVMLFFLISGFVIYYSTARRGDLEFADYFKRRFRRIYPIYLMALALAVLCSPNVYSAIRHLDMRQVFGNIFMLQDFGGGKPGVFVDPLGGNTPLWSLSYEWWFYMLFFPVRRFVKADARLHFAAGLSFTGFASYLALPNQISLFLMYFILWWSGAELARTYLAEGRITFASQRWTLFYLCWFVGCMGAQVLLVRLHHQPLSFGIHPVLELRHFLACLIFLVGAILWSRLRWRGFERLFSLFAYAAPISYALYVFHSPLAITAAYLQWMPTALQIPCYIVVTIAAAYLAEVCLQPRINRLFDRKVLTPAL